MKKMILITTILFSGLIAGLLFSYACSVNLGLHLLSDGEYVKAIQAINSEIQNVYFFIVFIGILFLLPTATWQSFSSMNKTAFYLLLSATIIYFIGVFVVTMFGNIPLNNQMAAINLTTINNEMLAAFRNHFESYWATYHLIRTAASIISFLLIIIATLALRCFL